MPTDWHVAFTLDYNGDGRDGILGRHDTGTVTNGLAQDIGSFAANNSVIGEVSPDWQVQSPDAF